MKTIFVLLLAVLLPQFVLSQQEQRGKGTILIEDADYLDGAEKMCRRLKEMLKCGILIPECFVIVLSFSGNPIG
jgi:hypothetical protein